MCSFNVGSNMWHLWVTSIIFVAHLEVQPFDGVCILCSDISHVSSTTVGIL